MFKIQNSAYKPFGGLYWSNDGSHLREVRKELRIEN
jgi:hypothetical protein